MGPMKLKDSDRPKEILDTAIPFLEKLGVCVAAFAGGGAIAKYASEVFPPCPGVAVALGLLLIVASLVLALLVVYETWRVITTSVKNRWVNLSILFIVLVSSVFFVIAGGLAAFKALAPP
jgi:hypothetical protein